MKDASSYHHTSRLWCSNPHNLFRTLRSKILSDTTCFLWPPGTFLAPTGHLPRCAALTISYLPSCPPHTRQYSSASVTLIPPCKLWLSTPPMEAGVDVLPVPLPMRERYSKHCQLSQCHVPVWFHAAVLSPTIFYPRCLVSFLRCLNTKATPEASKKQDLLAAAKWAPLVPPAPVQQDFKPRRRNIWIVKWKRVKM